MAQDRSTTDAILTEHFRYTPLSVIDDIINSVNSIIYKALTALESGLLSQPPKNLGFNDVKASKSNPSVVPKPASEVARAEIENGTHALETLLEAAVDKNFDIFELFALQHIFSIDGATQDFVRLKHYDGVVWPLGAKDVDPEKLAAARETLRKERELGLALERENKSMDMVLRQLKALASEGGPLGLLAADRAGKGAIKPLSTTAQFSTSQLPGLKTLVRELRAKLDVLPASAEELKTRDVPGSTSDEERKRYVESVAKRAVRENLGSTEQGESGLGPARDIGEVRALEQLMGGGGRGGDDDDDDDDDDDVD